MKGIILISLLLCFLAIQPTTAAIRGGYGLDINLGDIVRELRDRYEVERQVACVVGQGACNERGEMLKRIIPDMTTRGKCVVCSSEDERKLRLVIATLQNRYPRCWFVVISVLQRNVPNPPRAARCSSGNV